MCDEVFKNGISKRSGTQPLKALLLIIWSIQTNHIQFFQRLSFRNFTWSIPEHFLSIFLQESFSYEPFFKSQGVCSGRRFVVVVLGLLIVMCPLFVQPEFPNFFCKEANLEAVSGSSFISFTYFSLIRYSIWEKVILVKIRERFWFSREAR